MRFSNDRDTAVSFIMS